MSCWWRMCAGTCSIFTVSDLKQQTLPHMASRVDQNSLKAADKADNTSE